MNQKSLARTALCTVFFAGSVGAEVGLTDIGALNGGGASISTAVSSNGAVTVGIAQDGGGHNAARAFQWTPATGMQSLGVLNGGAKTEAHGVSGNGSVVIGLAIDGAAGSASRAFRWTDSTGMQSLGVLNGGSSSSAFGISADGRVIVGVAADGSASNLERAFLWTQDAGMKSLGVLNGGTRSKAVSVSANGDVVVGLAEDGSADNAGRAFRWTSATGMESLGTLNGGVQSLASGVSVDGSVVVGMAQDGAAGGANRAFRWTASGGMQNLGVVGFCTESAARGVSAFGSVVVGHCTRSSGVIRRKVIGAAALVPPPIVQSPPIVPSLAFRWTQSDGMRTIEAWLRASGARVVEGGVLAADATATNNDGSVVVGQLQNGKAFVARGGSGLVVPEEVATSLSSVSAGSAMAISAAATVISGAHSHPLARRVASNQKTFWVAGDWGRDDHGDRDGDLGLAEVGGGLNFGPAQINLSIGQTWAKQATALGGRTSADGNYLMAEAITPLHADDIGGFWMTLSAYMHWGNLDVRRAYPNAGTTDSSTGTPGTKSWGLRARVDWENAIGLGGTALSPYFDLSLADVQISGYSESGGGFPARFDERREKSHELRLGMNSRSPMANGSFALVSTLESVYRTEGKGVRTTGEVIGLFGFNLDAPVYKHDWLRAAAGIEGKLGAGTASLMLNATTRGEALNTWLAASYQMSF